MTTNFTNFDFEGFRNQEVLVFITGPGYLEYPWSLETALRLRDVDANGTIIDLSGIAERYAMRLTFCGLRLPVVSRKFLRLLLLKKKSRIENVVARVARSKNILYKAFQRQSFKPARPKFTVPTPLKSYSSTAWGAVPAQTILRTVISNRLRVLVDDAYLVSPDLEAEIREPIQHADSILKELERKSKTPISSIFVCNGRQPIQAAITLGARELGIKTILCEAAGGFVFPKQFKKRIDYFLSSPHDVLEMRQKISHLSNLSRSELFADSTLIQNLILDRKEIPFSLDYLPKTKPLLPLKIGNGRLLVFFTSSEWELSALAPWNHQSVSSSRTFVNQYQAIQELHSLMSDEDKLIVRIHPSDPGKKNRAEAYWQDFASAPNIQLIGPNDTLDSYQLAAKSDLNFVWASFIGVELILREVPVCIMGPSVYSHLVPNSSATNLAELKSWILKPLKSTADQLLPYFAYLAKGGFPILSSETSETRGVTICGEPTDVPRNFPVKLPSLLLRSIS